MRAIIYNRVSTAEQNPQLQLKECKEFAKRKNLEVISIVSEQASAFKQKQKRWEEVVKLSKLNKADIILWRYDRAFRNRKEFYEFMKVMFEFYNIKVYSVKEPSILSLWEMMGKQKTDDPIQSELINGILKVLWNFIIQQAGEQAEEESLKKGQRVKLAVIKKEGKPTKSYKGNVWGRKIRISKKIEEEVLQKRKDGLSIREIADSITYFDKNRNKKFISKSAVHKILNKVTLNH